MLRCCEGVSLVLPGYSETCCSNRVLKSGVNNINVYHSVFLYEMVPFTWFSHDTSCHCALVFSSDLPM